MSIVLYHLCRGNDWPSGGTVRRGEGSSQEASAITGEIVFNRFVAVSGMSLTGTTMVFWCLASQPWSTLEEFDTLYRSRRHMQAEQS